MATKPKITSREKARTKKKVGLAVYFTFIATFALCFGAQLWMIDVFNPKDDGTNPQTYSTNSENSNTGKSTYSINPTQSQKQNSHTNTDYSTQNSSQNPQNQNSSPYDNNYDKSENQNKTDMDYNYLNRNNQNYPNSHNIDTYN